MRGYSLINSDDGLAYCFVVANNTKEAKKLMLKHENACFFDFENPIIKFYAKWDKEADITGLSHGDFVEGIDLIKRGICTFLEYETCPICKEKDVGVYLLDDGIICCSDCEDKLIENSSHNKEE